MSEKELIQPNAIEFEEGLLGAIISNEEYIAEAFILEPKHFYKEENRIIYKVIISMFDAKEKIDVLLVSEKLKKLNKYDKIGGLPYVSNLIKNQTSKNNVKRYSEIIVEKFLRREGIQIASELLKGFYDDSIDVFETIDKANSNINDISAFASVEEPTDNKAAIKLFEENLDTRDESDKDKVTGVPSGFDYLDKVTGGFQPGDLVIDAGRPGMGKSASATDIARYAASKGYPVGLFSLEMSSFQVWCRIIARGIKVNSQVLTKRQYKEGMMGKIVEEVKKRPGIYVDSNPELSITTFKSKARKLVKEKGVKIIIVDYLQLMSGKMGKDYRGNENLELNDISKGLKAMAMELDIPIIALAQLSRDVEKRGGAKIPKLSDLRGSGGLEQDADIVMFHYRPEYYGIKVKIAKEAEESTCKGLGCVIIEKHRGGSLAKVWLRFDKDYSSFSNYKYDLITGEELTEEFEEGKGLEEIPF